MKEFFDVGQQKSLIDVRTSYRIIQLFSEGLYSSPHKAVEELVSNSFDAGAQTIHGIADRSLKAFLWCAFSRLIITKNAGASLAMDVSHRRPHRVYENAPIKPLERFVQAAEYVLKAVPFKREGTHFPKPQVARADARTLPLPRSAVDLVITSPPYLNAIDYLRGHKLSLVWMGHTVQSLRRIRSSNIGSEVASWAKYQESFVDIALSKLGAVETLPNRICGMLVRYIRDMDEVLREIRRVLKKDGRAVLVAGDSTIRGKFIRNSKALAYLAERHGLLVDTIRQRNLRETRRYLPPPAVKSAGTQLQNRMREEVIMTFVCQRSRNSS